MSLIPELTAEQVDDWFRIGKKTVKVKAVKGSTSGGHNLDPETLQPKVVAKHEHVPHYKRQHGGGGGHSYVAQYREEEAERLRHNRHALHAMSETMSVTSYDTLTSMSTRMEELELDSTIAGTEVHPADLAPENANQVYTNYDFSHVYDNRLPIEKFREQVVQTIESNTVTVIQGATGSGKTTQVAQYILDHYVRNNQYCNIIVTQPRRIAAISIARRVCNERGWELGSVCGYQVGLDKVACEDTRILYCTTGILLNQLINEKSMQKYTHVILDEVHERDQETDFALLVVRKLSRTNSHHTHVVLMSATFDSETFAEYFGLPVMDRLELAPIVDVEGKPFEVKEFYMDNLTLLGPLPDIEESDPSISKEAQEFAVKLVEQFDKLEAKDQGVCSTGFAQVRGTVLIFLPGLGEITDLEAKLRLLCPKHNLTIIPLHSTITMEEQSRVFNKPQEGYRKVILSTNIAESSITVPDIKYVIDFCLTKNLECDFDTNYTSLQVRWASKANCTQRKGRAGRVSNGRVYRLVTRDFYESCLPDYGLPEMLRSPLDKLILQVKVLDLGEPKEILALALSPPKLEDIERNILMLKEVGALTTSGSPYDGELTFVGRVLADLPVDTKIGKLIMLGHVFGLLEECLIIGAAMSLKSIFAQPFKLKLEAYKHKLAWAYGSQSDSIAILNAFQMWRRKRDYGEFRRTGGGGEDGWGKKNYVQIRRVKEVDVLMKELEKRLVKFNITRPKHEPHYKNKLTEDQKKLLLKVVLCGAFYPNYFIRSEVDEMESLKSLAGHDPLNTVMVKGLPANQGVLYKDQVEDIFRKCESSPKATFEETRGYIEFPRRSSNRSRVNLGVYMAIKMRLLRSPMQIDAYSSEEARLRLQRIKEAEQAQSRADSQTVLYSGTGARSSQGASTGSRQSGPQVELPSPNRDVEVILVTHVEECGRFWAQYRDEVHAYELRQVQEELNWERGQRLQALSGRVTVGLLCAAPYMDETVEYYRAKVQTVQNEFDNQLRAYREVIEVFFVDYGNVAQVTREELRELPQHLHKTPFQAFECQLTCIRPSVIRCPDGKWTAEANSVFQRMVMYHTVMASPFSIVHGVVRVQLSHRDPQLGTFNVADKLVEMGFADFTEESALSKQIHEQRMAVRQDPSQRGDCGPGGGMTANWKTLSEAVSMVGHLGDTKASKINLKGPTNPCEMNFVNITNVGRLRATKIEAESVNSVAIDDEPHDTHQRMMVAGFVGLNPNRSTMIARDTTIMPLIPGLPALLSMLFAPTAEFRVDRQKTRYIGAICGLGACSDTGYSMLPDHDIEMPFDVTIKHQDIFWVNGVRMAINVAIGSQDSTTTWGENSMIDLQNTARFKLLELLQRRRDRCEPEDPQCMYAWNQVAEDDILRHEVRPEESDRHLLLNLHSGVNIDNMEQHEYLKQHVQYLRQLVKQNTHQGATQCELCDIRCPSLILLALHLETFNHKEKERELFPDTSGGHRR